MLTICIGYDRRESIAYHVLCHSIMRRASQPVRIVPINLANLSSIYTRPRSPQQSTDFTYTRFLTPSFADDNAVSVFLDCDMLCLTDICELEDYARNQRYADVLVVKHDYVPNSESKFLGQVQTVYPCKNWSSVMVFNGGRQPVRNLTPHVVNTMSAMELHQFHWADNVGSLPPAWNHLVGEYEPNPAAKLVHFTNGGPWFSGYSNCEYSAEWDAELRDMLHRDSPSFDLVRHLL
jgi:lipopolysaccharide biosynthesis glycosyltransferase